MAKFVQRRGRQEMTRRSEQVDCNEEAVLKTLSTGSGLETIASAHNKWRGRRRDTRKNVTQEDTGREDMEALRHEVLFRCFHEQEVLSRGVMTASGESV